MDKATRKKRNRYELLADLLKSSKGGARKTSLMYAANLSFDLLNKYLALLAENGFIEKKDGFIFPSRRGAAYLRRFSRYQRARVAMLEAEERVHSILPAYVRQRGAP